MTLLMQGKKSSKKRRSRSHHSYANTNNLNNSMASVALTESFVCDRLEEEDSCEESVLFLETKKEEEEDNNNTPKRMQDTKTQEIKSLNMKKRPSLFKSNRRFLVPPSNRTTKTATYPRHRRQYKW